MSSFRTGPDRGTQVLLAPAHDPSRFESLMLGNAQAPAAEAPPTASSEATNDPWAKVLGHNVDNTNDLPRRQNSSSSRLPLPEDAPTSVPASPGSQLPKVQLPSVESRPGDQPPPEKPPSGRRIGVVAVAGAAAVFLSAVAQEYLIRSEEPAEQTPPAQVDAGGGRRPLYVHRPDGGRKAWTRRPTPPPVQTVLDAGAPADAKPLGLLSVMSKPTGATIELDGGYIGKTPLVIRHQFQNRAYTIRILSDGYEPWEKSVRPSKGSGSITVLAELEPQQN